MRPSFVKLPLLVVLGLLGLVPPLSPALGVREWVTVLHTNDHHGHFAPFKEGKQMNVGGMAAGATLIQEVRQEVGESRVLLLSAGDISTGVPESDLQYAKPDIELMNQLGYDAMVLGNHEFDLPFEILQQKLGWAQFDVLGANVIHRERHRSWVHPFILRSVGKVKMAILGLTTQEAPRIVSADNIKLLRFEDVIQTARRYVPVLKAHADLVVLLTHVGYFDRSNYFDSPGDIALARALPEVDVIVGGHTHGPLAAPHVEGKTLLVYAGAWGKYVGRLDLQVDTDTNQVLDHRYRLLPVNYQGPEVAKTPFRRVKPDPKIEEHVRTYLQASAELLNKVIGHAKVPLGEKSGYGWKETVMGNLITDALRVRFNADVAVTNGGGIRDEIGPGPITLRDLLRVLPFNNTASLVKMTGAQLRTLLEYASQFGTYFPGFLQASGVRWVIQNKAVRDIWVGDRPLDLGRTYSVVTNNFVAAGGDGHEILKSLPSVDTGLGISDIVRDYIQQQRDVEPQLEGRIIRR